MSEVDRLLGGKWRSSNRSTPPVRYSALSNSQSDSGCSVVEVHGNSSSRSAVEHSLQFESQCSRDQQHSPNAYEQNYLHNVEPIRFNEVDPQGNPILHTHSPPNSMMPVPAHSQTNSVMPVPACFQPDSGFSGCIPHPQNQVRDEPAVEQDNIAPRITDTKGGNNYSQRARLLQDRSVPLRLKYASACAGLFLTGIIILLLLIFIWVATITTGIYVPIISYSTSVGVTLSILVCITLPACIRCLKAESDGEPRRCCYAKCTLYVSVFLAVSFAFVGASIVSLLQIVFTIECSNSPDIISSKPRAQAWGSIIFIFSVFAAIFCFFVAIMTIWKCYKDSSRKCSNFCVKMFILQVLLHLSSCLTLAITMYSSLSQTENAAGTRFDVYNNLGVAVSSIGGGVVGIPIFCLIFISPILCILEATKHQYSIKISGIYMIFISLVVTAGSFAAGIVLLILISHISHIDGPYYGCLTWHKTPSIVMSALSAVLNLCVAGLGVVSFVFGCYGLWSRNAH